MSLRSSLEETCLPLADGSVLLITLDDRSDHEQPFRDTSLSYAVRVAADGTRHDLMALLSLPLLPDVAAAEEARQTAAGQREVAAAADSAAARARYLDNADTADWEAGHVLAFAREMPGCVAEVAPGLVAAAYRNGSKHSRFQFVDLTTGTLRLEVTGPDVDRLFGGPQTYRRSAQESELLDQVRDQLGDLARFVPPNSGTLPSRVRLIAAGNDRLLFVAGTRGYALVAWDGTQLRGVRLLGPAAMHWRTAAFCGARCHLHGAVNGRTPALLVVDAADGSVERHIPLDEHSLLTSAAASRAGRVAFGSFDGVALVFEPATGALRRYKVNHGLDPYAHSAVSLSPDGRWLVATTWTPPQSTLVDLSDGSYAYLDPPQLEARSLRAGHAAPFLTRRASAVAVDGGALLLRAGRLEHVSASALTLRPARPAVRVREVPGTCTDLDAALTQRGFDADAAARVRGWLRAAVMLQPQRLRADTLRVGATKFGGLPDLLRDAPWPQYRRRPMAFLGQIDLAEFAAVAGRHNPLPARGLLSFFRAMDQGGPMFYQEESDPADARVLYTADLGDLVRATRPRFGDTQGDFETPPCSVTLVRRHCDLPSLDSVHMRHAGFDPEARENYLELSDGFVAEDADLLRSSYAGGWPKAIQNNAFEGYAERITRGLPPYGPYDPTAPEQVAIDAAATRWVQLLQLDSGGDTGWMWGDAGILHWMIPADDLAAARFDRVVCLGECH